MNIRKLNIAIWLKRLRSAVTIVSGECGADVFTQYCPIDDTSYANLYQGEITPIDTDVDTNNLPVDK